MLVFSDKVNNSLLQYHSELFKSNTVLPIKSTEQAGEWRQGVDLRDHSPE